MENQNLLKRIINISIFVILFYQEQQLQNTVVKIGIFFINTEIE